MIRRLVLVTMTCLASLLISCSHISDTGDMVRGERAGSLARTILLVNSNAEVPRYLEAQKAFQSTGGVRVNVVDLALFEEPVESLWDVLNNERYDGVYAIGAKALLAVDYISPDAPVVYSSVLNWRKFSARENFYGIANEMSPQAQLTWFKYIFPKLERLGVVYSSQNEAMVKAVMAIANKLGIELVTKSVSSSEHVEVAIRDLGTEVKQLWLLSDSVVMPSSEKVKQLFSLTRELDISVLSYDELFLDFGALISVDSDRSTTGNQAALLINSLMVGKSEKSIRFPAGSRIVINKKGLKDASLKVNPNALESISDIR